MKIQSVYDAAFAPYGRVVTGFPTAQLLEGLGRTPLPKTGTAYTPNDPLLADLPVAAQLQEHLFGGMPVQLGWCNGHNTQLNCLEYHRDSEFNLGTEDFILLLAKQWEVVDGTLDTACVQAFRAPAGVLVEVYATTLHYAPCHTDAAKGFRVMVALPAGTNLDKPALAERLTPEDDLLWARNKWLLAHPASAEAAAGAAARLRGENIDIAALL